MILWLLAIAVAVDLTVTPVEGPAHSARETVVQVLAVDERGEPLPLTGVRVSEGTLRRAVNVQAPPGAQAWIWTPPSVPGPVTWSAATLDGSATTSITVTMPPAPVLRAPERLEARPGVPIELPIFSDIPIAQQDLDVHVSEPASVSVTPTDTGALIRIEPTGQGARSIIIAVAHSARWSDPVITRVAMIVRHRLRFDLEPGATLTVRLGKRMYGPALAGPQGGVEAVIDQRPGETTAELVVADDLGNELVSPYVLSARAAGPVLLVPLRAPLSLEPLSQVRVIAVTASGAWLTSPAPTCTIERSIALTSPVAPGHWRVKPVSGAFGAEARVACQTPEREVAQSMPFGTGRPRSLQIDLWPQTLNTDSLRAEVTAHALDGRGERLPDAAIALSAQLGTLDQVTGGDGLLRANYLASDVAVRRGQDTLRASLFFPSGHGAVQDLALSYATSPSGRLALTAVALDARGHPVPAASVDLALGDAVTRVIADGRGRATAELEPLQAAARPARATVGAVVRQVIVVRGRGYGPPPDAPDLQVERKVLITQGRIATLQIEPADRVISAARGAELNVVIRQYDRSEALVNDLIPRVEVSSGSVDAPRRRPDGSYVVVVRPPIGERTRAVTFTASSPSGEVSASTQISVESPPIRLALGLAAGMSSNLQSLRSPLVSIDADIGTSRVLPGTMVRLSVSTLGYAREVETGVGRSRQQLTLIPLTVAGAIRRPLGPVALQAGAGFIITPFRAEEQFDDQRLPQRTGLLTPGFVGLFGAAVDLGGGEIMVESRFNWMISQGRATGFQGQLGGIAGVLGYRLRID